MGYDLHITRKECWADEEDEGLISRAEWKAYVEADPDVTPDPDNPHEDYYVYVRDAESWPLWFNPRLGNIYTKNPPDDVIEKVVKIAAILKARVQGDDQEFYDLDGNMIKPQEQLSSINESKNINSYDHYVWYFCAVVFVISIIWHTFK
ncbi:hypothetical protein GCM10011613_20700 [Cellvibrio zantedeschiae]|uniref:Uncharacterized protein n=1 Tax=Cellvibrio zantedeschiae TaxID=1237077 RepID=A0ABQ3B1Y6_9GAMM|nr:hypothetical protein [Cellvibrio zantedeschiae]GGY75069.1 hypothetical protein GCM10011613_20700 [Cellvibrio zantedeschiae]